MMCPSTGPTLKEVLGELDYALQNCARLHLMAQNLILLPKRMELAGYGR